MVNCCCVSDCKNESYPGSRFSFHTFPKNENLKSMWVNAVPGKISKWSVICSAHFKCDDFIPGYMKKILKPDAVPSIFAKVPHPATLRRILATHEYNVGFMVEVMGFLNVKAKKDEMNDALIFDAMAIKAGKQDNSAILEFRSAKKSIVEDNNTTEENEIDKSDVLMHLMDRTALSDYNNNIL